MTEMLGAPAPGASGGTVPGTVRLVAFDVLRRLGLTTLFANPGSTEVPLLADLPEDLRFVLGLHESAVVGMAAGYALGRGEPALAVLHTTAGLGNAVAALATARVNRAPLVVLVGQQDRRHLAFEPFLSGRLEGLAGDYPVWLDQPVRAEDVPGAIARAFHEAATARGPALVIVPMDDWLASPGEDREPAAPARVLRAAAAAPPAVAALAELLGSAASPALVVGAGADDADTWAALVALAERLRCPVWQEPFGARAGFPQDHPLFAGHLPAARGRLREALTGQDVVLVVGGAAFRQYAFDPGPFVREGTTVAVVTDDPCEAHRSAAELVLLAPPGAVCAALARELPARAGAPPAPLERPAAPPPPGPGEALRAGHVLAALAERLPADAVVVEEAPSSRPELNARIVVRRPLGFLSAAMGGLGFAFAGAAGLRMALPRRPVVAIVGDGSAVFGVQALWSAARYRTGVLFVVLANGGYAIMDRLAEGHGGAGPWPSFEVDVAGLARALGCPARRVEAHAELVGALDELVPELASREEPMLLEAVVAPDDVFRP